MRQERGNTPTVKVAWFCKPSVLDGPASLPLKLNHIWLVYGNGPRYTWRSSGTDPLTSVADSPLLKPSSLSGWGVKLRDQNRFELQRAPMTRTPRRRVTGVYVLRPHTPLGYVARLCGVLVHSGALTMSGVLCRRQFVPRNVGETHGICLQATRPHALGAYRGED